MDSFLLFFELGYEHITDLEGYDHILFVLALCSVYKLKDWRQVLILITAFTIGHTVTLGLATFDVVLVSSAWIEFLIPVTILCTCVFNLIPSTDSSRMKNSILKYVLALLFGLIHGLGFSYYLKNILVMLEEEIVKPLFSFNVGLEFGQLLIVFVALFLSYIFINKLLLPRRYWNAGVSIIVGSLSIYLIFQRFPFLY